MSIDCRARHKTPTSGGTLLISCQPEVARLYIDGKRLPIGTTVSANRDQQLVAVAPGFYGKVRELSASDTRIVMSLQPLTLPGSNEAHKLRELVCSLDDAFCVPEAFWIRGAIKALLRL